MRTIIIIGHWLSLTTVLIMHCPPFYTQHCLSNTVECRQWERRSDLLKSRTISWTKPIPSQLTWCQIWPSSGAMLQLCHSKRFRQDVNNVMMDFCSYLHSVIFSSLCFSLVALPHLGVVGTVSFSMDMISVVFNGGKSLYSKGLLLSTFVFLTTRASRRWRPCDSSRRDCRKQLRSRGSVHLDRHALPPSSCVMCIVLRNWRRCCGLHWAVGLNDWGFRCCLPRLDVSCAV